MSGCQRVAKFIAAVSGHFWAGVTLTDVDANGQACTLLSRGPMVVALVTVDGTSEGIDQIFWLMRPSKLGAVPRP